MKENFKKLYNEFLNIKKKEWIKGSSNGQGNVGITFEVELGKERENFPIPDYEGIEIKTSLKRKGLPGNITLFSATPDGPCIFQTQILKEKYGWSDKILPEYKIFYATLNGNKYTKVNKNFYMKLEVDRKEKRVYLKVCDSNFRKIERECFWDFSSLEEKLLRKLKYLAYVEAEKKTINNEQYFKYNSINFYQLKSFEQFLHLLEIGKIKLCFKVGIYRSGIKKGKTYDHGTGFIINKGYLYLLYDKLTI